MPNSYDNKLLDGAGVAQLSQLIKAAIAAGVGVDEIYIGTSTPSTSQYKIWIDTSGLTDTFVKGITLNGTTVQLDANYIANLVVNPGYPTTTSNSNLAWNQQVLRAAADTTAISCVQPNPSSYSQEICGFFLADGSSCDFTVANATITYEGETTETAGSALSVEVEDGKVYEFSLVALSSTSTSLLLSEVG